MSWTAVDYAYGYNVYLDGSLVAQLDSKTLSYTCDGAGSYTVCAVGNNGSVSNSAVSEVIVISNADALNAPVVSYANNTITWTAVENASKYAIYCNGVFVEYVETTSYTVSKLGVYTVAAIGDAVNYADSLASNEVVLIDDTTVDLSAYSTTEQVNALISAAIQALKIGDYAKAAALTAAVERISAVENKLSGINTTVVAYVTSAIQALNTLRLLSFLPLLSAWRLLKLIT